MAKGNAVHVLALDKLSEDDKTLVVDNQVRAQEIVDKHNEKVRSLTWHVNWHVMGSLSAVPEL
jgi:UDP-N-acetylglucosamine transferase subunit ALG13